MSVFVRLGAAVCAALLGLAITPAMVAAQVLDPLDDWAWGKTDEYCGLVRNFGDASDPVRLQITSYGTTGSYRIEVSGTDLPSNSNAAVTGSAAFGSAQDLQSLHVVVGRRGDGGSIEFLARRGDGFLFAYGWSTGFDTLAALTFEPDAEMLTVGTPAMAPLTLKLGSMQDGVTLLRECEDLLLEGWNLDVPAPSTIAEDAVITNGRDVLRAIRLPAVMMLNRQSQIVQVRLVIDEEGEVADCALQSPDWRDRDARGLCNAFERDGEYTPARDASGQPVASLLRGTFLLLIYD